VRFTLRLGTQTRTFTSQRTAAGLRLVDEEGNAHDVRVRRRDGPHLELEIDGTRVRVSGAASGDARHAWVEGRTWAYGRAYEGEASGGADAGSLGSTIPAVVTEVLVAAGDEVKRGDKLVLLESMKMVLAIQAPGAGTVKAIHCEAGQSIEPGVPLVELEDA